MLKGPSLSRSSSQSPSPVCNHYATSSPRSSLRRTQVAKLATSPAQRPSETRRWIYVDAATQWSPQLNKRMENSPSQRTRTEFKQNQAATLALATPTVPAPESPHLEPQSPSHSKRTSDSERNVVAPVSTVEEGKGSPPKRARAEPKQVKLLPAKYELCEVEDIVVLVSDMILELIHTNDCLPLRTGGLTRFHSRTPPGISVKDYLNRLAKHATLTPPLLLSMVHYIDRLCTCYEAFTITSLTVHRFLITAATVAAKGLSDSFWNNATYARVGGLKVEELGTLELEFLHRIDWKIVPVPEMLVSYYKALVSRSEHYRLEDDGEVPKVDIDEQIESEAIEPRGQTATESQWNAWMEDVSTQQAEKEDELKEESSHESQGETEKGKG